MKDCVLMIDGGTTHTRFTLVDEGGVLARTQQRVGAANASTQQNAPLAAAVKAQIGELRRAHGRCPTAIYAAGMITSASGLVEIPHLVAPVTLADLAAGAVCLRLEEIAADIPFCFVPGIKFIGQPQYGSDILRGEEVEVFGALGPQDDGKSALFLHFGSHNKMIRCEGGAITQAVTTLSGELLWAAANHTILKSSVCGLEDCQLEPDYVLRGFASAEGMDITRAMFMARIQQVLENARGQQALSFLYGALLCADMRAFSGMLRERADSLVLYGRDHFIQAFLICLEGRREAAGLRVKTRVVSFEESQWLSVRGLWRLHTLRAGEAARGLGLADPA